MPLIDQKMMRQMSFVLGHSINIGFYGVAGALLGYGLERFVGISLWGYIIFVPLAFSLGFYRLVKAVKNQPIEGNEEP